MVVRYVSSLQLTIICFELFCWCDLIGAGVKVRKTTFSSPTKQLWIYNTPTVKDTSTTTFLSLHLHQSAWESRSTYYIPQAFGLSEQQRTLSTPSHSEDRELQHAFSSAHRIDTSFNLQYGKNFSILYQIKNVSDEASRWNHPVSPHTVS